MIVNLPLNEHCCGQPPLTSGLGQISDRYLLDAVSEHN